jgi:enolase
MIEYYEGLIAKYPLVSIEDPLDEEDWDGWAEFVLAVLEELGGSDIKGEGDVLTRLEAGGLDGVKNEVQSGGVAVRGPG